MHSIDARPEEGQMMTVEQLMKTRVVTAHPRFPIRDALAAMAEAGVRHLPVVDEKGALIGIVSQLDLVRALDLMRAAEGVRGDADTHVEDVMSAPAFRATRKMLASDAVALMMEQR